MADERVVVAIVTPFDAGVVARIGAVDDRVEVRHEPGEADVLFGVPRESPEALAESIRSNPGLRWVQATADGVDEQVRAAGLTTESCAV